MRTLDWPRRWDEELLLLVQRRATGQPSQRAAAALSSAGEHARVWLAVAALGAAADPERRPAWTEAGAAALAAHAAAVVLKRVVRRPRPAHPLLVVHGRMHSRLSFPSAHAASTTAAALALRPLCGSATLAVVPAMALARLRLGVHYPSDVLAGMVLGSVAAAAVRS